MAGTVFLRGIRDKRYPLAQYIKANRYMRENRDGTISVLMSTCRIDKEVAGAAYDSFIKSFNIDGSMPEDEFRRLLDDTKRV